MTLREALRQAIERLDRHSVSNARLNTESLIAYCIGQNRTYLYTHDDRELTPEELQRVEEAIYDRISGTPVQYIVGHQEFFGRDFLVNPSVLIPRPESELIVEAVLALRPLDGARLVDVGTGSGCIGVTLALEFPNTRVMLTDISLEAVRTARLNAAHLAADVTAACMDLLHAARGPFDVIVSNPPYIPIGDEPGLQREVREHEPSVALFGGDDGLSAFRRLIPQAESLLRPGGYFIAETGFGMEESALDLLGSRWERLPTMKDLQGIPRTIRARLRS